MKVGNIVVWSGSALKMTGMSGYATEKLDKQHRVGARPPSTEDRFAVLEIKTLPPHNPFHKRGPTIVRLLADDGDRFWIDRGWIRCPRKQP